MLVKGDVKCLHCGFITGQWVGTKGAPITVAGLASCQPGGDRGDAAAPVRCGRCEGPVYLEDLEPVISGYRIRRIRRLRAQIAALDADDNKAA